MFKSDGSVTSDPTRGCSKCRVVTNMGLNSPEPIVRVIVCEGCKKKISDGE